MDKFQRIRLGLLCAKIKLGNVFTRDEDNKFREEEHPRDEETGEFREKDSTGSNAHAKIITSARGANKFTKYGFMNRNKEKAHEKHLKEFEGLTMDQYIASGMELVQMAVGGDILGHKDKDEIITRYNVKTNEFVKGRPDRGMYTFFKPINGKTYYDEMKMEDLAHGGRD